MACCSGRTNVLLWDIACSKGGERNRRQTDRLIKAYAATTPRSKLPCLCSTDRNGWNDTNRKHEQSECGVVQLKTIAALLFRLFKWFALLRIGWIVKSKWSVMAQDIPSKGRKRKGRRATLTEHLFFATNPNLKRAKNKLFGYSWRG